MKFIIRCTLSLMAIVGCVSIIHGTRVVSAQTCCSQTDCEYPAPSCPSPACDHPYGTCSYYWVCDSPIILDLKNKGFHLTDAAHGVSFQFYGNQKQQVAWTDPKYGNAWLALDRNANGLIDNAAELFGNDTPQPPSTAKNGFRALAVYDLPENGGNGDHQITAADSIYQRLLLWTDTNHNGISEPDELQTLSQAGVTSISLDDHRDDRTDQYGNAFRYRSHDTINAVKYDHAIYDVFLVGTN